MDYAPFGGELSGGTKLPDQRFAGLFRDGEAGLDYAQARSCQVRRGRFSAPDPVHAGMFDPQQWNRYSYALNAPTGYTDRSGLSPIDGFFSWPLWATVAGSLDRPAGQQASLLGFGIGGEGFYAIDSIDFSLGGADGGQTSPATPTNVTQEKVDPNVPPGTPEDLVDILTEAFQNADKRLNKPKCSGVYGGIDVARAELHNATYRFLDLGGPRVVDGEARAIGAATFGGKNVVINTRGPFVHQTLMVPGQGLKTLDSGTNLRGSNFRALILLHELGHLTNVFGSDAGNAELNQKYTNTVYRACF